MNRFCVGAILFGGLGLLLGGCGSNTDVSTIQITPATQTLAAGQTAQFKATGMITHGKHPPSTQDVTATVTWASNAPAVATISPSGLATAVSAGTATITASMQGAISATATVTVTGGSPKTADSLVSLSVVPDSQTSLAVNETVAFVAIGTTSSGATVNLTNQSATVGTATIKPAVWKSTVPTVATIDSGTGIATSLTSGSTTITATATNPDGTIVTGSGKLTVNTSSPGAGEPLVSLAIVPASQTLTGANQTAQFVAIGTTASGTTVDLTNTPATIGSATIPKAKWSSSAPAVATIDAAMGVATALSNGVTAITAVAFNPDGTVVTGTATLTVNISAPGAGESLVSLAIVPAAQTLTGMNQSAQFVVIGTTSSGTTVNLTNKSATMGSATLKAATWTSSSPSVATINSLTGIATSVGNGATAITAMASNPDGTVVTAAATLTVNVTSSSEPLVSLAIVPSTQTATVVKQTAQFIAIGTTSTGSTVNLTNQSANINGVAIAAAKWASSSTAVATVDSSTGIATAVSTGVVAITAIAKNPDGTVVTGTATFTVSTKPEPLVSLAIVPASQTLPAAGQHAQFIAIGTTASGATVNLTNQSANINGVPIAAAIWSSSSMAVATVDSAGLATSGSPGVTAITAMATNPDGTVVAGTATLTVNIPAAEPLVSLAIVPAAQQAFSVNQTAHFIAIGTTSTGTTVNLTNQSATVNGVLIGAATWDSSNPDAATVDSASGIATAHSAGTAAITAVANNPDGTVVTGTAAFTVTIPGVAEPLVSMAIVPASQTLAMLGQNAELKAIATTGTGSTVDLTNQTAMVGPAFIQSAVWSSSNPGVAIVNPGTGEVTAITAGTTVITAIAQNPDDHTVVTGVSTVTVTATGGPGGSIASIAVIPGSQAVPWPNATTKFIAIGTTTTGATVDLTNQVTWSSSSAQIATIGAATGIATAVNQGSATITALYTPPGNVVTGIATFNVLAGTSEQYSGLTIIPGDQTLSSSGQNAQFIALGAIGSTGGQRDVTDSPQIKWKSSAPTIAAISPIGIATGLSVGNTTITAELANPDGTVVSGSANVSVVATPAPEPLLSLSIIPSAITVGNLQGTGDFIAIGTFSTAPYVQDVTNSPNTTWISAFPDDFPVSTNSGGTQSASGGIVTAYASGNTVIIAEYKDPLTQSIQTATATFACPLVLPNPPTTAGSCYPGSEATPLKATLTVYGEGLNTTNWLVTAPSATDTPNVIHCGPGWTADGNPGGSVCVGIYPISTKKIVLTAPARPGVAFGGWTYDCTPSDVNGNDLPGPVFWTAAGPNYCYVRLDTTNVTVSAIFNNP